MSKQARMWGHEDLPLFSGAAVEVEQPTTSPGQAGKQEPFDTIKCRVCLDTGMIEVGQGKMEYCWCDAGRKAAWESLKEGESECSMCGDTGLLFLTEEVEDGQ